MTEQTFILPAGRSALLAFLERLSPEKKWRVRVGEYKRDRSLEQNAVSHGWYAQISRELDEDTPEGVKRFCKLTYGVPLLREDADFNAFYECALKGLTYQQNLEAMKYLDCTSLMNTAQMLAYMTAMQDAYALRGVALRYPNDPPEMWE